MAPHPQHDETQPNKAETLPTQIPGQVRTGEEILITGVSGTFPESENVTKLMENLFNEVDMVNDEGRRWKLHHPEIPQRTGKLKTLEKFDAQFFGVHYKLAWPMDPMCRMLLENVYQAVIDAGVSPKQLSRSKTGVFVGSALSESEKNWFYSKAEINGFGITGCSRAMLANRLSYWLGTTGPSFAVDASCSSSMLALEQAYVSMRNGMCDAAIVAGCNLCLHPYTSFQYSRMDVISPDGISKSFDKNANGWARSEAIGVLFLQKAKDARRVYAEVVHVKSMCDTDDKGDKIFYQTAEAQKRMLKIFYEECNVSPLDIEYIEAHGTGLYESDGKELTAMDEIFCKDRVTPLKIGSVKSNLGHSESSSGICALAKMCISYDSGYIPRNLNFSEPRDDIPALLDGRMSVVTKKHKWNKGYAAVNSLSLGGVFVHALLKNFAREKGDNAVQRDDLPRLVTASGRSDEAVKKILDDVESRPIDVEHIRLIHAIHEEEIKGHVSRGYTLIKSEPDSVKPVRIESNCDYFPGTKRPVWFVYSGMGSQWAGMGSQLMRIPIFAAAIEKCHQALAPKGIDIVNLITNPDRTIYDNILHSFIGIAAVQIGLTDILYALGIKPDYIIGHSVGELGCAYADGCFTPEQMILSAYSRGLASIETPFIRGSMAAIGLGYQEVKKLCPPEIEVACHNGPTSSTISGPADIMKSFVAELVAKGIFAKEVPCSNIAYHSRYIAEAGPTLLKYLKQVIKEPKERSPKWVSTSVPQAQWKSEAAQYSSAEYHTNNLLGSVLFEETSRLIPYNAITIEIAPHGLLQAILNRSMKKDCTNIALTKRGHPDNVQVLLTAIGKLYQVGLNPMLANLYPHVEFPVSAQTPMLSQLVEWEHSESWFVGYYTPAEKIKSGERVIGISLADNEYEFLSGHVVDGINTFPEVGYLVMVWESIGRLIGVDYNKLSVMFTDVQFKRKVKIIDGMLEFQIAVHKGTGNFEIMENNAAVVTGRIFKGTNISGLYKPLDEPENGKSAFHLTSESIYKEFELRGYNYKDQFKSIISSNVEATKGTVKWNENWITYLDSLLQLNYLSTGKRELYEPLSIGKLSIDVDKHWEVLSTASKVRTESLLEVTNYVDYETIRSAGTEIQRIQHEILQKTLKNEEYNFSKYEFVSHFGSVLSETDALTTHLQIAFENVFTTKFNILEVLHSGNKVDTWKSLTPAVQQVTKHGLSTGASNVNMLFEDIRELDGNPLFRSKQVERNGNIDLLIGTSLLTQNKVFSFALNNLNPGGFILSLERSLPMSIKTNKLFNVISAIKFGPSLFYVLMRKPLERQSIIKYIPVSFDKNYSLINSVKNYLKSDTDLVLVSENESQSGLLGLLEQLRKEEFGEKVRGLIIDDVNAPTFTPDSVFYDEQLKKNLFINVYCYGQWGSYHSLRCKDIAWNKSEHAYLAVSEPGNIQSLQWFEGPLKATQQVTFGKQLIHVYNSGLMYRDVLKATGQLPLDEDLFNRDNKLGFEYAGRTTRGERVMGLVQSGGVSTLLEGEEDLMWPVPIDWSLEDAATVPGAYAVAYLALVMRAYICPGHTVLIHSAAGSVGQAAINICLHYNCEIFVTVGTEEKKHFIRKKYPQIKESHIGNSRDRTFLDMVRIETNGKGVSIVLNCLADDKFQESVQCLGLDGRLIHIGLFDFMNNEKLGMSFLIKQTYIGSAFLDTIFRPENGEDRKKLHKLISEGIANGVVQPLNRAVFETDHIDEAFRYLSSPRHIGKVVIKYKEEESRKPIVPTSKLFNSASRYICNPNDSYLVVGDLSGAALETAEWLIRAGAMNIILQSPEGTISNYCPYRTRLWQRKNVNVHISTYNITTLDGCVNLLNLANNSAPLHGIFFVDVSSSTGCVKFDTLSPDDFKVQYEKRSMIAKQLDLASRNMCSMLKDFVIITTSSDSADVATSLALINQVCEDRVKTNLPALAVHLEHFEGCETNHENKVMISFHNILESLPKLLNQRSTVVKSDIVEKKNQNGYKGLVKEVAGILDLGDFKKLQQELTLKELQVNVETAFQVRLRLQQKYCLFFTLNEVLNLSIEQLHKIEAQDDNKDNLNKRVEDMALFVKKAMDEMDSFQPFFDMCTMTSDGADSAKYEDELVEDETAVLFVPGMDGFTDVFAPIAKYIKMKAYGLITGYDYPNETVEQTSQRVAKNIKTKLAQKGNYFLCGFSYGAVIALEVAASLEKEGRYGKVFCIDGSPEYLKSLLTSNFSNYSEHDLQNAMLSRIFEVISPVSPGELNEALTRAEGWHEKVEIFLKISSQSVTNSDEYRRYLVNTLYRRLDALSQYNNYKNIKLKSQVVLIRDKNSISGNDDYGLNKMCDNPVKVYTVEGNHSNIINNILCSKIINNELVDHLDNTIINPFIQYNPM